MSETVRSYLASTGLIASSLALLWWANSIFLEAQRTMSSTFEFQLGLFSWGLLIYAIAGATVGLITILGNSARSGGAGHLYVAAILPTLLVANFLTFLAGINIGLTMADGLWLFDLKTIAVAAFTSGALVSVAIVRTISRGPVVE